MSRVHYDCCLSDRCISGLADGAHPDRSGERFTHRGLLGQSSGDAPVPERVPGGCSPVNHNSRLCKRPGEGPAGLVSSPSRRTLRRHQVGGLPLIHEVTERMHLRSLLSQYIPSHGNDQVPVVDTLLLLILYLTLGKEPLYELPRWVASIDSRCIGYDALPSEAFNDDRFGRALVDRLYQADRASLMTELVSPFVTIFQIELQRIHNDSTTVKAYGQYPGKTRTGLELTRGHSKDHRPDLKQRVFSLSLSAGGAVPVHHQAYPGDRTDDKTHIDT